MSRREGRRSFGAPLLGRDVTVDGGTAALLAVTAGALLIGVAGGPVYGMVGGVAGAIVTVAGVIRVADADPVSRGLGSVALVAGAVLFTRALALPDTGLGLLAVICGSLAVLAVATETLLAESPPLRPAVYALLGSAGVMMVAGMFHLVVTPSGSLLWAAIAGMATPDPSIPNVLLSLVLLQVLVVGLSLVIDRANAVLRRWIPPERTGGFSVLERLGIEASEIPRTLWAFLGAQLFLALLVPGLLGSILAATAPGSVLYTLLTSSILHLPLAALLVLFLAVLGAEALRGVVMRIAGYHPPTVIGLLAGGLLATAVASVIGVLSVAGVDVSGALAIISPPGGFWFGAGTFWTGSGALLSTAARTAVFVLPFGAGAWLARNAIGEVATGASAGAALLFGAAVAGSEAGAHPVAVFVTVGLALAALEAGSRSSRLSRRLGDSADTRSAELVHLLGSAIALVVGIALATTALYVVVPAAVGLGDARGVMLLFAGLVGLFAALLVFGRRSWSVTS